MTSTKHYIFTSLGRAGGGGSSSGGSGGGGGGGGGSSSSGSSYSHSSSSSGSGEPAGPVLLGISVFFFVFIISAICFTLAMKPKISSSHLELADKIRPLRSSRFLRYVGYSTLISFSVLFLNATTSSTPSYQGFSLLLACFSVFVINCIGSWAGIAFAIYVEKQGPPGINKISSKKLKKKLGISSKQANVIATETFNRYQADWTNNDDSKFNEYLTKNYRPHASFMIRALLELRRKNRVTVKTLKTTVMDASNKKGKKKLIVNMAAGIVDELIDERSSKQLFIEQCFFEEIWTFKFEDDAWKLDAIDPSTANRKMMTRLESFARNNNFFYSLDTGWLFLPTGGDLFKDGKFGSSDINNHVIGDYHGQLIQMYTYREKPNSHRAQDYYTIAQIHLKRRNYKGILVKNKKEISRWKGTSSLPKGYKSYRLEWREFNDRYAVSVNDTEAATAFELLSPDFMAFLHDNWPKANIEVVDNIIYIYERGQKTASTKQYKIMLKVLHKAFEAMKL